MKRQRLVLAVAAFSLLPSCGAREPYVWVEELPVSVPEIPVYRIRAGDEILVSVWNQEQLTGVRQVRPDGCVTVALVGDVVVAGLTTVEASALIQQRLEGDIVQDARVNVTVAGMNRATVSVLGEVRNPGQFEIRPEDGLLDVLSRSGGLTEFAHKDRIFLLRRSDAGTPRIRFDYERLTTRRASGMHLSLRDGDVIVVE